MDTTTQVAVGRNEKGMVIVYAAILMVMLFGLLGLAVDSAHLFKVRNELQNAADAAALKGAWYLYTRPVTAGELPTLDFPTALTKAQEVVNKSDNQALSSAAITVGYWNLDWDSSIDHDLQPTTITPTIKDVPAVRAVVNRAAGSNGGPVGNFFMQVLGQANATAAVGSRPAVAMSGFPGAVPPNNLFPMALSKCMTDHYFSQVPMPVPPPQINISSAYGPGGVGCYTGQWTSFKLDKNDVPTIQDLIVNGNPDPVQTGDDIWIEPGAKNALFKFVDDWLPVGGKDVLMAIVDGDLSSKGELTVTGFATFHIDGAENGSSPYVYGHFIEYHATAPGIRPGGTPTNTVTLPIMAQ